MREGGREGGTEEGRNGGPEEGRNGGWEREGGREGENEGGREKGGREGEKEEERYFYVYFRLFVNLFATSLPSQLASPHDDGMPSARSKRRFFVLTLQARVEWSSLRLTVCLATDRLLTTSSLAS